MSVSVGEPSWEGAATRRSLRIWVDLSTAPDPLFFRPIVRRLTDQGHWVWVTARDYGSTGSIARQCGYTFELIGRHGGRATAAKVLATAARVRDLSRQMGAQRLDLATSFNSYAQAVAARMHRLPFVTFSDYEYQPANHLAFRLACLVVVPDGFDRRQLRRQGATPDRVLTYPGLKEDVTVADFSPDPSFPARLTALGVPPDAVLVTMRPPATASLYHRFANDWFYDVVRLVAERPKVTAIVTCRYPEQVERVRAFGLANVIVPDTVLDGLNLVHSSDLVISAGGSMNREAVALGTPAASVFAGRMAGVDRHLIDRGLLVNLAGPADLARLVVDKKPAQVARDRPSPVDDLVASLVAAAGPE